METTTMKTPEVWLRGPLPNIPAPLQPLAHALMQGGEDVERLLGSIQEDVLWERPGGAAALGFHIRHAAQALDRLYTYARGESLSDAQRLALSTEKEPGGTSAELATLFSSSISAALAQLEATDPASLTDTREVGRARLPSTVLGLLFHGAEHTARHVGQAITTSIVVAGARTTT